MWMEERRGTRINAERVREVLTTGADTLVVGCPFCLTMLRDGVADAGAADQVATVDIAEILAACVAGGPSAETPSGASDEQPVGHGIRP
jgi:Fe-S oxidoreductase